MGWPGMAHQEWGRLGSAFSFLSLGNEFPIVFPGTWKKLESLYSYTHVAVPQGSVNIVRFINAVSSSSSLMKHGLVSLHSYTRVIVLQGSVNIVRFIKEELKLTASDAVIVKMDIDYGEWSVLPGECSAHVHDSTVLHRCVTCHSQGVQSSLRSASVALGFLVPTTRSTVVPLMPAVYAAWEGSLSATRILVLQYCIIQYCMRHGSGGKPWVPQKSQSLSFCPCLRGVCLPCRVRGRQGTRTRSWVPKESQSFSSCGVPAVCVSALQSGRKTRSLQASWTSCSSRSTMATRACLSSVGCTQNPGMRPTSCCNGCATEGTICMRGHEEGRGWEVHSVAQYHMIKHQW